MLNKEALLQACDDVHEGKGDASIQTVIEALPLFPDLARSAIVLPALRRAAEKSSIGSMPFGGSRCRPQILELLEAPPTWIYGGKVGVWCVAENDPAHTFDARAPRSLIITGGGPREIRSRVAPIVADLASERGCQSDLIVAGLALFDLAAESPPLHPGNAWSEDEFCAAVIKLAQSVNASEAVRQVGTDFLRMLAPQVLRPTVGMAVQALQGLEFELGFVCNREIDTAEINSARRRLAGKEELPAADSLPLVAEYRLDGKPLEIELDEAVLGIRQYSDVAEAFARTVHRQRKEEWKRRCSQYEDWAMGTVREWHHLCLMKPHEREAYSTLIHWQVNFETASRERMDPPQRPNGVERLEGLPQFIASSLAWWALAKHRIEVVSSRPDLQPWMDTYLVDAFLRGQPQLETDSELKDVYERWQHEWRPVALHGVDTALREQGTSLAEVGVEQTIFRVLRKQGGKFVLRLQHVWDAGLDPPPSISPAGVTVFQPRFAERRSEQLDAPAAQSMAVRELDAALAADSVDGEKLTRAMSLDSGEAIDRLLDGLAGQLKKKGLENELKAIQKDAVETDPLLRCGLFKKLHGNSDLPTLVKLGAEFGAEGRRQDAVPDFRAWELFLVLEALRQMIANFQGQIQVLEYLSEARYLLPPEMRSLDPSVFRTLAGLNSWQILEAGGKIGPKQEALDCLLRFLGSKQNFAVLVGDWALLRAGHPAYWERCLAADGPPPRSEELERRSVPNCFQGWKEVCYYLAKGDSAAALAQILLPVRDNPTKESLADAIRQIQEYRIHDAFPDLHGTRQVLLDETAPHLAKGDHVSIEIAAAKAGTACSGFLDEAGGAYAAAAFRDGRYGVGWVRLASLRWAMSSYRDALRWLIGPAPLVNLLAAHFPLELAVRLAGGTLKIVPEKTGRPWTPALGLVAAVDGPDESGDVTIDVFQSAYSPEKLGHCVVSGVGMNDAQLLANFFRRYQPDLLRSAGQRSFQEWLSLVQVPSIGRWGEIATAYEHSAEAAVLAASVCLGTPRALSHARIQASSSRPRSWLEDKVISSLTW